MSGKVKIHVRHDEKEYLNLLSFDNKQGFNEIFHSIIVWDCHEANGPSDGEEIGQYHSAIK